MLKDLDSRSAIIIKGARENNLKNIDLIVPKNKLVVFTGLSGSGKSTLAFDTIYTEGQRRYVESLSSYARQFLGNVNKPDVDSIDGLSPAVAIEQKTVSHNPRSIVGTVTEIYDFLRLLFGRIGTPYCPYHNEPIVSFSTTKMTDIAMKNEPGSKIQILSPVVINKKGSFKDLLLKIKADGYERIRVDGKNVRVVEVKELEKNNRHNIDIIVDRIILSEEKRSRVFDSINTACKLSSGYVIVMNEFEEKLMSSNNACPLCGFTIPKLEPRLFSFNAPLGACPDCNGLGVKQAADINLIIKDWNKSISKGGIEFYKNTVDTTNLDWQAFEKLLNFYNIDKTKPLKDMTKEEMDIIKYGSKEPIKYKLVSSSGNTMNRHDYLEGICNHIERLYQNTTSEWSREWYANFIRELTCPSCEGARLSKEALSVKIDGLNIYETTLMSLEQLHNWVISLYDKLTPNQITIGDLVLQEIKNRTGFLVEVGLEYVTLGRSASTLSGGEAQRIRLATQIGSKLSGVLYVLDEPSIGLHQKDNDKLIKVLREMVDLGNSLIVVEHDEETMRTADYIVDIGPGAGVHGGVIVVAGDVKEVENCKESITGDYLSGRRKIEVPVIRKKINKNQVIKLKGCTCNNLKNVDVDIPLGLFVCVTGVSGSGKSSLINETLQKAVERELTGKETFPGNYQSIKGLENIDKVINISQEPIGKTPRSNPATYVGAFDDIRDLYAETREAKEHGFDKSKFSFNVKGGRCEKCWGTGVTKITMNFLPDVYVVCDECQGKRYNEEVLKCRYKDKNISDVLETTLEEATQFFENRNSIYKKLKTLVDVGLGYMKVGQPATTLSGGEAQRVKLAYELQKSSTGKTLYILDEPTTGLHTEDVRRLIEILQNIVNNGNTVVVIEHNMDMIKVADYIIDVGPHGGDKGGQIIATGTPEEVSLNPSSFTGQYLKKYLKGE